MTGSSILRSNVDPLIDQPVTSPFWLPVAERTANAGEVRLASRARRLGAALIDALVVSGPLLVYSVLGRQESDLSGLVGLELLIALTLQVILLGCASQTIGKRLMRIRIVRPDGRRAHWLRVLVLRYAVNVVIGFFIPIYALVETLYIFRVDRRCVHDRLADTIVACTV